MGGEDGREGEEGDRRRKRLASTHFLLSPHLTQRETSTPGMVSSTFRVSLSSQALWTCPHRQTQTLTCLLSDSDSCHVAEQD